MVSLRASYNSGYGAALADVGLEKDANKKARGAVIAGAMALGGFHGGKHEALKRIDTDSIPAREAYYSLMENLRDSGDVVDTKAFIKSLTGGQVSAPEKMKSLITPAEIQASNDSLSAFYNSGLGVVAGAKANPTLLAHEALGHGSQHRDLGANAFNQKSNDASSLWGQITGKSVAFEEDAWNRAVSSGFEPDKRVVRAALDTYQASHDGALKGALTGGAAGAGSAGLSALGLLALAQAVSMGRKRK